MKILKIKKYFFVFLVATTFIFPIVVEAQSRITDIIFGVAEIFNYIIFILMALATVVFLYGIVSYIIAAGMGDERKMGAARSYIIWGIIALFCMVAVWGLVNVLLDTFGLGTPYTPIAPGTP